MRIACISGVAAPISGAPRPLDQHPPDQHPPDMQRTRMGPDTLTPSRARTRARDRPMIELMLQAERALVSGMLDQAERLYAQAAELDPRNSIAVVGLARVALDRADDRRAYELARRALEIDPENAAAQRLAERLNEVMRYRGETVPVYEPAASEPPAAAEPPAPTETPATPARRSLIDRLLRRR
jgi:tetratricopeptide (TPR) repeat protein